MKKLLQFTLFSLLLVCQLSFAQVSGYGFSRGTSGAVYTPLVGGTVFQSGIILNTDAVSAPIAMPSFTFNNVAYTQFYISNNGYITFAIAPTAVNYTPMSNGTAGYAAVSGFGGNLVASTVVGSLPGISYGSSGPDFIIQFKDLARSAVAAADVINFQVVLKSTGNIDIVYGNCTTTSTSTTIQPQVGIRGLSNADNVVNRLSSTFPDNTPSWADAGFANTGATATNVRYIASAACYPVSGLTFSYYPPAIPIYASVPYVQNFDAAWSNINQFGSTPSNNWKSTPTVYNNAWRKNDDGLFIWSSILGSYTPTGATTSTGSARFHSFNASGTVGNLDLFVDCSAGTSFELTFDRINIDGLDILATLLSTDGGLTFTQLGSNLGIAATWTNTSLIFSSTSATTVIRFRGTGDNGNSDIGLDNVKVGLPPSCLVPSLLTATNVTTSSANMLFTSVGTNFIIEYGAIGFVPGTSAGAGAGTIVTGTSSPIVISSLLPSTSYDVYIRQDCSATSNGFSSNSAKATLYTGHCLASSTAQTSWISAFSTTGGTTNITHTAAAGAVGGYVDLTATNTVSNFIGQTTSFSITSGGATVGNAIWIDWNNNLVFETTERVYVSASFGTTVTGSFSIPAATPNGNYRMRVITDFNNSVPSNPCGLIARGEYKDFTFAVFTPIPCTTPESQPTSFVPGAVTALTAAASFTAAIGSPSGYLSVVSQGALVGAPVDGVTYALNAVVGTNGLAVQSNSSTSVNAAVPSNTVGTVTIFSYNSGTCTGGPKYNVISPLVGTNTTCPLAPTSPLVSSITASGSSISWTASSTGGAAGVISYSLSIYSDPARTVLVGSTYAVGTNVTQLVSGLNSASTYYYSILANNGFCASTALNGTFSTLCIPAALTTTDGSRCGTGTVVLTGTPSSGTTAWYAAATGGSPLFTGNNFTTPSISTTTNYYAESQISGSTVTLGAITPTSQGGTIGIQTVAWNVNFTVSQSTTLTSVDVFPITSGQAAAIALRDSAGTVISTINYTTNVSGGATAQTINLGFAVVAGSYQLFPTLPTAGVSRNISGAVYPYTSSVANIIGNGFDATYYMSFYNWKFDSICASSPRNTVTATVIPAPSITTSSNVTICSGNSTTLTVSSANAGYAYAWSPATGLSATTGASVTANPTTTTTYTVTANDVVSGCSNTSTVTVTVNSTPTGVTAVATPASLCEGGAINLSSGFVAPVGMSTYTASRTTGTSYTSIFPATNITTWRAATATNTDDNMSNNQPIGFNFNYNGAAYSTFRISTNGFLTFDSASTATGGGLGAYGYANDFTLASSGLIVAPNWDDLQTAGNLSTAADLNNSINYTTTGASGSRVLTVEWKNMQDFSTTSTASYNWQIKLYESDGRIEFVYGTMTQSASSVNYSLGLSAATVSVTPTAAQLLSQTTTNTSTFGFTNQTALSPVPASNSTITFVAPIPYIYSWTGPNSFTSSSASPVIIAATAAASGVYNLVVTNPATGCPSSQASTAAVIVNPTSVAGTVSSAQSICSGATPVELTLSGNVGTVTKWQSATNVGFTAGILDIANTTSTLTLGALTTTTYYRAVVQSGVCTTSNSNIVTITVTPNTFNDTTATACDSYTWASDSTVYTTSGTYLGTTVNCVTPRLLLTITPSSFSEINATACDSYTWTSNNTVYTSSGTYLGTPENCVTPRLILTITPSSTATTAVTACDTYTWANNNTTYTTSGTYTGTTTNCVTEQLTLTITPLLAPTFAAVAPLCLGDTSYSLPLISSNGVVGTWAPAFDNLNSGIYIFTPTAGQCATTATLSITIGGTTTWTGVTWDNGIPTSASTAIIAASYSEVANITACTLTITSNAVVTIPAGNTVTLNGILTVVSGSTFTLENGANLIQASAVANATPINVKRTTPALMRQDYVLWSSPVANQNLLAFSPQTVITRFNTYNPANNQYVSVASPSTTNFSVGTGYLIRLRNNHPTTPTSWTGTFTGVPNNGPVGVTVTSNTFNAVGNPYPSAISADAFMAANNSAALYFWRKTNNTNNASYAIYTAAGGVANSGGDTLNLIPNGNIQVGQGFLVRSAVGASSLNFTNAMRVSSVGPFLRSAAKSRIWLDMTSTDGIFSQTMVAYMLNATSGIDNGIDGLLISDATNSTLSSLVENQEYAIQGRALPFENTDVVPLSFKCALAGNHTVAINHVDGLFDTTGQAVYIQDNLTNTVHNLGTPYNFVTGAGVFNSRFQIVYQPAGTLATTNPTLNDNNVIVYKQDENVVINTGAIEIANVKIFDIRGRLLIEKSNINTSNIKLNIGSSNQVLIVKIISKTNEVVTKKIIN